MAKNALKEISSTPAKPKTQTIEIKVSEPDLFSKNGAETVSITGSSPSMVKISESNNSVTSPATTKPAVEKET